MLHRCVAWFTNKNFLNALIKKKKKGLDIRILISDEEKNKTLALILENEFIARTVSHWGYN